MSKINLIVGIIFITCLGAQTAMAAETTFRGVDQTGKACALKIELPLKVADDGTLSTSVRTTERNKKMSVVSLKNLDQDGLASLHWAEDTGMAMFSKRNSIYVGIAPNGRPVKYAFVTMTNGFNTKILVDVQCALNQ